MTGIKPLKTILQDGRIQCRVTITGTFRGRCWSYTDPEGHSGSQFIWPDGEPSRYWWETGNMACDCNRGKYLPIQMQSDLVTDSNGIFNCGREIVIKTIAPLDTTLPTLDLTIPESKE